jgi:hypothetical protein
MCVLHGEKLALGPIVRKSHCFAANICSFISQYALEMYITSDALFAFMKNNLFALIKFLFPLINISRANKQRAAAQTRFQISSWREKKRVLMQRGLAV